MFRETVVDTEEQDRGEEPIYQVYFQLLCNQYSQLLIPTYQVPRSICLPICTSAEEEGEKENGSVNERQIVTKNVEEVREEEEGEDVREEEGTQWESFSPCQETLVPGGRKV